MSFYIYDESYMIWVSCKLKITLMENMINLKLCQRSSNNVVTSFWTQMVELQIKNTINNFCYRYQVINSTFI